MDTTDRELDLFARSGPGGLGILASREQLVANAGLAGEVEGVHEMEVAAVLAPRSNKVRLGDAETSPDEIDPAFNAIEL